METFSALLALLEGNPPVTGEFPLQRPMMRSFNIFFGVHLKNGWANSRDADGLRRHRRNIEYFLSYTGLLHSNDRICVSTSNGLQWLDVNKDGRLQISCGSRGAWRQSQKLNTPAINHYDYMNHGTIHKREDNGSPQSMAILTKEVSWYLAKSHHHLHDNV